MTFIITPYNKAFKISAEPTFDCVVSATYNGVPLGYQIKELESNQVISPIFTTMEQDLTKCYIECEDLPDCQFYAIDWLSDFLKRLSKNPHVIHCTSDCEMFID